MTRRRPGLIAAAVVAALAAAPAEVAAAPATPYPGPADSIGAPANGCLAGAQALPPSGPGWLVLRPSRNRFWGNPALVAFLGDMGAEVRGLGTLLIGDMAQPRGGRMVPGHASHQTGLDVDIMYRLVAPGESAPDLEDPDLPSVVTAQAGLAPERWGDAQTAVLRTFARDPRVERIFVNPAVKATLCRSLGEPAWLAKLRPWWGHAAHFHVRLACPAGDADCVRGQPLPEGTGCGAEVESWIASGAWNSAPKPPAHPAPPPVPPAACKAVWGG